MIKTDNSAVIASLEERIAELERENGGLRASRMAYASEFDGDVGSIHENIRILKRERDEFEAALRSVLEDNYAYGHVTPNTLNGIEKSLPGSGNALARRDKLVAAEALSEACDRLLMATTADSCKVHLRKAANLLRREADERNGEQK